MDGSVFGGHSLGAVVGALPHLLTALRVMTGALLIRVVLPVLPLGPRRFLCGVLILLCIELAAASARALPQGSPMRVWLTSWAESFPLTWRDLPQFARMGRRAAAA